MVQDLKLRKLLFLECPLVFSDCSSLQVTEPREPHPGKGLLYCSPHRLQDRSVGGCPKHPHQAGLAEPTDQCSGFLSCVCSEQVFHSHLVTGLGGSRKQSEGAYTFFGSGPLGSPDNKGIAWFLPSQKEGPASHYMGDALESAP